MTMLIELTAYLTVLAAAEVLGVDPTTVTRWVDEGKLRAHVPRRGSRERSRILLWEPDVLKLREARKVVAGNGQRNSVTL